VRPRLALDLVEDERRLVLSASVRQARRKSSEHSRMPPSPKMGSSTMGAGVGIDSGAQCFDIVLRHKGHVFEHRLKPLRYFSWPVRDMAPNVRP